MRLKIKIKEDLEKEKISKIKELKTKGERIVLVSTNKLKIEYDRIDNRIIKGLKDIKFVYPKKEKGCYILKGNIYCTYKDDFKGEFYATDFIEDDSVDYSKIKGVKLNLDFSNPLNAIDNGKLKLELKRWINNSNFVFNIEQFDEFMDLFEFYKSLSTEISNNSYCKVSKISNPYYYINVENYNTSNRKGEEILDSNNLLIGYKFNKEEYDQLANNIKENTKQIIDITVTGRKEDLKKIKKQSKNNLYLSNEREVSDNNVNFLQQVYVTNIEQNENNLVISGQLKSYKKELDYKYLNLYDMGQKIKIDSIDNSLRLIKQGNSGAAIELLEYLIGDEQMPNNATANKPENVEQYISNLNKSQREAFLKAIDGSPVTLLKGPPGTGKTHVINAIVQYITKEMGEKVIISSQTHIAIDNVLDKLMSNFDPIIPKRITNRQNKYSLEEIDTTLYKTWGTKLEEHLKRANSTIAQKVLEQMKNFDGEKRINYSSQSEFSVIGATTTTSAIGGKKGLETLAGYKWLIIDEVSKCPITEVLRYLPYVEKVILVGDDFQLAPLLEFDKDDVKHLKSYNDNKFEELKTMYENSIFAKTLDKARNNNRLVELNENYRSVKDVLQLYNVFYNNQLIAKRETINPNKVQINSEIINNEKDVFFVEVKFGKEAEDGTSRFNVEELEATKEIIKELIKTTVNPEKVNVAAIFPYGAQISKFQKENADLINQAKRHFKSFEIDTVDEFQGKEADIVLCNTVVTDKTKRNFLSDFRRINVSMSRAKDKLIIFGNSSVLSAIDMNITNQPKRRFFSDIIEYVTNKNNGKKIIYEGGLKNENTSTSSLDLA